MDRRRSSPRHRRPCGLGRLGRFGRTLVTAEFLLAASALGGGAYLMARAGSALPARWLAGSPFSSWLWPGAALIAVNGVVPVLVALNAFRGRPAGHMGHPLVGLTLIGWVTAELTLIGDLSPAQPALLVGGLLLLALGLAHLHRWRDDPDGGGRGSIEVSWLW